MLSTFVTFACCSIPNWKLEVHHVKTSLAGRCGLLHQFQNLGLRGRFAIWDCPFFGSVPARLEFQGENMRILCIYPIFGQTNIWIFQPARWPQQKNMSPLVFPPKLPNSEPCLSEPRFAFRCLACCFFMFLPQSPTPTQLPSLPSPTDPENRPLGSPPISKSCVGGTMLLKNG